MGLTIDNEAVAAMIRALADRRGTSPEAALRDVLEREAERDAEVERKLAVLLDIAARARALPILDPRTPDEILGYDDDGLPS